MIQNKMLLFIKHVLALFYPIFSLQLIPSGLSLNILFFSLRRTYRVKKHVL